MDTVQKPPFERLRDVLLPLKSVAIALSGGLDSSVLLAAAVHMLGKEHCLAMTASTPYVMSEELEEGHELCRQLEVRQEVLEMPIPASIADNPPLRCYLCKHVLFSSMQSRASELGFSHLADGSNLDDLNDYRPGRKALKELAVLSPFLEAHITKDEIRTMARDLHLPQRISGKPAYACLLTRLEHGRPVTVELLRRVDEAERFLRSLGLKGCRVRVHGADLARIELPSPERDLFWQEELGGPVAQRLTELGFRHITLDLRGYARGSMNQLS